MKEEIYTSDIILKSRIRSDIDSRYSISGFSGEWLSYNDFIEMSELFIEYSSDWKNATSSVKRKILRNFNSAKEEIKLKVRLEMMMQKAKEQRDQLSRIMEELRNELQ